MDRLIKNKKAQISIFIIMGIVLVMGVGMYLYLRAPDSLPELEVAAEEVPLEIKPIQDFVHSCLYEKAREATVLIGQHGGYVDMGDTDYARTSFELKPADPTESDAAFLNFQESSHVAYWWFLKSKNNCFNCLISDENKPAIQHMEYQIETYIRNNIDSCLDGFKGFENSGFDIDTFGEPKPKVVIAEKDVFVSLEYPTGIKIDDRVSNISRFVTRVNLNLKDIYDLAAKISAAEADKAYLENIAMHVISLSGDASFDRIPPIYDIRSSFVPVTWSKTMVEMQLKSLFTSHYSLLQLNRTKDAKVLNFSVEPEIKNVYSPFFVDVLTEEYPEYSVRFMYLNWPLYFHITPSQGETIKPSQEVHPKRGIAGFTIPFIFRPWYYYEYFYDVSFPVIVEIKQDNQFFNETYTFLFALEVNVRDNLDLKEWFEGRGTLGPWEYDGFGLRATEDAREQIELDFMDALDQDTTGIFDEDMLENSQTYSGKYTKTLLCNSKQRVGSNVTITLEDKGNHTPVEGAEVFFSCGNYETCRLGRTELDSEGEETIFNSKLPVCIGGSMLRIEKPGYMKKTISGFDSLPGEILSFDIELDPFRTKNVSVKKYVVDRVVYNDSLANEIKRIEWDDNVVDLEPFDMVMITFNKIKEEPLEEGFSKFLLIYGNDSKNKDIFRTVDLVPGDYTLDIQYFYTNKSEIPENCSHLCDQCRSDNCEKLCRLKPDEYPDLDMTTETYCSTEASVLMYATLGGGCIPCEECDVDMFMPEEPIALDNQILGGFRMNETEPWTLSEGNLDRGGDTVEFYLVHAPQPRCISDLDEPQNITRYYDVKKRKLVPRIITI